jgi:hypothetical protein
MIRIVLIMRRHLYLLLNSFYISGIILIGAQVLLFATWQQAFLFATGTFFVYLLSLRGITILVRAFSKSNQSALKLYKDWILVAGITTALVAVYGVLVNLLCKAELGPPKYYFYGIVFAGIVYVTTANQGLLLLPSVAQSKKASDKVFTFILELIKSTFWVIVFAILGTAYSQILTGTQISSGEMFLVFYTTVGGLAFILVPVMKSFIDSLENIMEQDKPE